jgi:hypothetical protein
MKSEVKMQGDRPRSPGFSTHREQWCLPIGRRRKTAAVDGVQGRDDGRDSGGRATARLLTQKMQIAGAGEYTFTGT